METTVKNIGLLFISVLLMMIWGFYHTFFKLFTSFHNSNVEQHLYKIVFFLWFAMLVAQVFFSRSNKTASVKLVKNTSYLLAPLVMFAIYCAAKDQYFQDILQVDEAGAIARQILCLPNILAFGILYILAMLNKEKAFNYMRYTIAGTTLLVGIGLSHVFMAYIHFPFSMSVSIIVCNYRFGFAHANDERQNLWTYHKAIPSFANCCAGHAYYLVLHEQYSCMAKCCGETCTIVFLSCQRMAKIDDS